MAEIILTATPRPPQGTRPARRLRNEGKVPGVVYGLGADPITLTVEWRELRAALVTEQGLNAVIHLEVDGDRTPTLVKDMQRHPVRRNVLHVDFIRVDLNKPVDVDVPIHLEGEAEAVSREGGVIDQILTGLAITAKPSDIPAGLTVDITDLEIGGAKHVSDIVLPEGVTTSRRRPTRPSSPPASRSSRSTEPVEGEEGEEAERGRRGRRRRGRGRGPRVAATPRPVATPATAAATRAELARGRRRVVFGARRVSRRSGGAPRPTCSWSAWPTRAPSTPARATTSAARWSSSSPSATAPSSARARSGPWSTRSPSTAGASPSPSRSPT